MSGVLESEPRSIFVVGPDGSLRDQLTRELAETGFPAEARGGIEGLADIRDRTPNAVVLLPGRGDAAHTVRQLRGSRACRRSTLVYVDVPPSAVADVIEAGADDALLPGTSAELPLRLARAMQQRGMQERAALSAAELAALLDLARAATSTFDVDDLLHDVVQSVARVVDVDRCSAVLVDPKTRRATVVASHDVPELWRLPIELSRYPEIRSAFDTRRAVVIDDAHTHPLMVGVRPFIASLPVRSIVVVPLVAHTDTYGALFLRFARRWSFDPSEQAFLGAAASTIAQAVHMAHTHSRLSERFAELERAHARQILLLHSLNEQLQGANRHKDSLLEVCSHDLRSPLSVVMGHASLLMQDPGVPAEQRHQLSAIERQAKRAMEIVEAIIDRGRSGDRGHYDLSGHVDLNHLVRTTVEDLARVTPERNLLVSASEPLPVIGDAGALRRVLENLVRNALQHAPGATDIDVRATREAGMARVEVRDRGAGIAEDQLTLVFERYRRRPDGGGMGLGLAICREVIEAHGGRIWAESPYDGGARLVFTIPLRA